MADLRRYVRPFKQPLATAHGLWKRREGALLRLESHGRVAFGEIAPVPWFGSESLAAAESALQAGRAETPCVAFALGCARDQLTGAPWTRASGRITSAALLPLSEPNLATTRERGATHFKLKIATRPLPEEQATLAPVLASLQPHERLRLDANGGLDLPSARAWLDFLAPHAPAIDYLEQPLPPGQESSTRTLAEASAIPLALDESVATAIQAEHLLDWPGPLVLKPAIFGSPGALLDFAERRPGRLILSSVFETAIGFRAVAQLALCTRPAEVHGLGTAGVLVDDGLGFKHQLASLDLTGLDPHADSQLWDRLPAPPPSRS